MVTRLVMPPPRLPQPAAVALATPMMLRENICAHHVCEQTNAASEKPIRQRQTMKPVRRERDGVDRLLVVLLPRVCAGIFTGSVGGEHHPDDAGSADRHEHEHALAGAEFVHHGAHD